MCVELPAKLDVTGQGTPAEGDQMTRRFNTAYRTSTISAGVNRQVFISEEQILAMFE
jgi:hypothetical protein